MRVGQENSRSISLQVGDYLEPFRVYYNRDSDYSYSLRGQKSLRKIRLFNSPTGLLSQKMKSYVSSYESLGYLFEEIPTPPDFILNLEFEQRRKFFEREVKRSRKVHDTCYYSNLADMICDINDREVLVKGRRAPARIIYQIDGTKTGRLGTSHNSLPILTMTKENRADVIADNDAIVEVDFNAADLRIFLHLSGNQQPKGDLHSFNANKIYNCSRDEAKKHVFHWLFSSKKNGHELEEKLYNKRISRKFLSQDQKELKNKFGRTIAIPDNRIGDEGYALSMLLQSMTAEFALRQFLKAWALLKESGADSFIKFIIHDAVYFDLKFEELEVFQKAVDAMKESDFGRFPVNIKRIS